MLCVSDGTLENREDARRFIEIIAKQLSQLDIIIDDMLMLPWVEQKTDRHNIALIMTAVHPILERLP